MVLRLKEDKCLFIFKIIIIIIIIIIYNNNNMDNTSINNIFQFYHIAECLEHIEFNFANTFKNLKKLDKKNYTGPCLFIGAYNVAEIKRIRDHKAIKGIIYGGNDINFLFSEPKMSVIYGNSNIDYHFALSSSNLNKAKSHNINCSLLKIINNSFNCIFEYYYLTPKITDDNSINIKYTFYKLRNYTTEYNNSCLFIGLYDIDIIKQHIGIKGILIDDYSYELLANNSDKLFNITFDYYLCTTSELKHKLEKINISAMILTIKTSPFDKNILTNISNSRKYDFYNKIPTNNDLPYVQNNIDNFSNLIQNFKNILFIASDYPGYGGSATNCYNLINYYKHTHNVYGIFYVFNVDKYDIKNNASQIDNYKIIYERELQMEIEKIPFVPDLIILKNFISIDTKKKYNCPVIFLIAGIFSIELDTYYNDIIMQKYTDIDKDKYINQKVINQIYNSELVFCNSYNTAYILKYLYNIDTYLFYSSFIKFYGMEICKNNNRLQYDYGIIISDFNKKIKNIDTVIKFLSDKSNVVLIGCNSKKYERQGFKCMDFVDNQNLFDIYKQISNVVSSSFYESCSNVMIEAIFSGCNYINLGNKFSINILNKQISCKTKISFIDYFKSYDLFFYILRIIDVMSINYDITFFIYVDENNYNEVINYINCNIVDYDVVIITHINDADFECFQKIYFFDHKIPLLNEKNINMQKCILSYANNNTVVLSLIKNYYTKIIKINNLTINFNYKLINNNIIYDDENLNLLNNYNLLNTIIIFLFN